MEGEYQGLTYKTYLIESELDDKKNIRYLLCNGTLTALKQVLKTDVKTAYEFFYLKQLQELNNLADRVEGQKDLKRKN